MLHKLNDHIDPDVKLDWPENDKPWVRANDDIDEAMKKELLKHRHYIFKEHTHGEIKSQFNFPFMSRKWFPEFQAGMKIVRESLTPR